MVSTRNYSSCCAGFEQELLPIEVLQVAKITGNVLVAPARYTRQNLPHGRRGAGNEVSHKLDSRASWVQVTVVVIPPRGVKAPIT